MIDLQQVTPDQVLKVYSGRIGCMCGCKGKYWAHPAHREQVAADRGYSVDDEECNLEQVTRVLRLVQAYGVNNEVDANDEYVPYYYVEAGKRCFCVYVQPAVQS